MRPARSQPTRGDPPGAAIVLLAAVAVPMRPVLKAGSSLQTGTAAFCNPEGIALSDALVLYGRPNRAPRFS